jgi:hypothetical protein
MFAPLVATATPRDDNAVRPQPHTSAARDIVNDDGSQSWLVVAWFTPDYHGHAERLSRQLTVIGAPHHLFACEKGDGTLRQITRRRPAILLRAMELYPSRTLISLDVDCHVHADLRDIAASAQADVTHYMKPRKSKRLGQRGRLSFGVSDRVLVLRPTEPANRFVRDWFAECANARVPPRAGSEWVRSQIMPRAFGITFATLPPALAGLEMHDAPPGAAITHVSENRRRNKQWQQFWTRWDVMLAIFVVLIVVPLLWITRSLDD